MGRDDPALRFRGHKRRRSQAQTEHMSQLNSARSSMASLHTQPGADKENRVSSDVGKAQERANAYQRSYYNATKKVKRAHTANADQAAVLAETRVKNGHLRAKVEQLGAEVTDLEAESSSLRASLSSQKSARKEIQKKFHALSEKCRRIPDRLETAFNKATVQAKDELTRLFSFSLKEKGVVPDSTRDMINDLVALDGVRPAKVIGVLKRIAGKLGIEISGSVSERSVRRITKEGGVIAKMQFVEAVGTSKGLYN
jgi:chromosome segregation ATPase